MSQSELYHCHTHCTGVHASQAFMMYQGCAISIMGMITAPAVYAVTSKSRMHECCSANHHLTIHPAAFVKIFKI
jgi:hypothetical protein